MTPDEYLQLDGLAMAERVANGDTTPTELVELAIARLEAVNPQINAVITPMFEEARRRAASTVPANGRFQGVPFLLKDLGVAYAGQRLTSGSQALANFVPTYNAEIVQRQRAAGLITLGKTNTSEFGLLPTTEPDLWGATRNPWDHSRSAGGSSGGSAAAVAAGIVPLAHATDGGGSIRIPAACCGLFGLKPSRGRISAAPRLENGISMGHCVSRSVRDSAALLDATAGNVQGDWFHAPSPKRPFLEAASTDPRPLRIAFTTSAAMGQPIHPDCQQAVQKTAALCANLGHHVEEGRPDVDANTFAQTFLLLWATLCATAVKSIAQITQQPPTPALYEPATWALFQLGETYSASDYMLAQQFMYKTTQQMNSFFNQYDLWLTPTVAEPPPPLGTFDEQPHHPLHAIERAESFVPFTPLANPTGLPAMSVPLHWTEAGLPVGVHFIGRFGDEATLLQLAGQLERAQPWAGRYQVLWQS